MVKVNQRKNLFASFCIIFITAVVLYVIETAEVFRIKIPQIHNEDALKHYESCRQFGNDCTCKVLKKCELCPEEKPPPKECMSTGRREYVECDPGAHQFHQQCTNTEYEAGQHFWAFYLSSGVILVGSCIVVNHRKRFLDHVGSMRQQDM